MNENRNKISVKEPTVSYDDVFQIIRKHGPITSEGIIKKIEEDLIKEWRKKTGLTRRQLMDDPHFSKAVTWPHGTRSVIHGYILNLKKNGHIEKQKIVSVDSDDTDSTYWKPKITLPEIVKFLKDQGFSYRIERTVVHTNGRIRKLIRTNM